MKITIVDAHVELNYMLMLRTCYIPFSIVNK